jgi:hypothetical protein
MKTYDTIELLNRAMSLAYYAHLGNPEHYQTEYEKKTQIKPEGILSWADKILKEENSSVLYYKSRA